MKRKSYKEKKYERKQKIKGKSEAYSFVETLSVLAISSVLAAGTTFSASKAIGIARQISTRSQIEQFCSALQTYFLDCGCFPSSEQGLMALWEKPILYPIPEEWNGPYLERKPKTTDSWGTDFIYINGKDKSMPAQVPKNMPFVLISYGADKQEGGESKNADIVSWE